MATATRTRTTTFTRTHTIRTMNPIEETDSYKLGHYEQYPEKTNGVYSYFEARRGARYNEIVFFGLHHLLLQLAANPITQDMVEEAAELSAIHFGNPDTFNREGWEYIVNKHGGKLPIEIKAVAEGTVVTPSNVVMTVENTDPLCWWLTNALESFFTHVWYSSNIATISRAVKKVAIKYADSTCDNRDHVDFQVHDFGYRSATTAEAGAIGGAGHLVNFKGTDTVPAIRLMVNEYGGKLEELGFSVPATEHSVMTALGRAGERHQIQRFLNLNPTGIISCVADSFNVYDFVESITGHFKPQILARDGKFVVRPDSLTDDASSKSELILQLLDMLGRGFGTTVNSKGFKLLHPKVGLLYGDGLDGQEIEEILDDLRLAGWASSNIVLGLGGWQMQQHNRDTERWAFKASAIRRSIDGLWKPVQKNPLDQTKASKPGRMELVEFADGTRVTVAEKAESKNPDGSEPIKLLQPVFRNGEILVHPVFAEVRERASVGLAA